MEKILYSFTEGNDGGAPSSLVLDLDGNLYGTAYYGGLNQLGVVFQLVPSTGGWTENVLYNFSGGEGDGEFPGGLIQDSHGDLYGFSECGIYHGGGYCGGAYYDGLIYELSPPGGFHFLNVHSGDSQFCPNLQSSYFRALTVDPAGNLYAAAGGLGFNGNNVYYCGAVASTAATLQPLISSNEDLFGNLTSDSKGNLYGTISYCGPGNDGMVWQYSP
jgi:uncharacterized repeat protein (TIGR03803 family)